MKSILKFLSFLFLTITILPLVSCSEDPEESTGTISGTVTVAPGGTEPLSGVTVSIPTTGQSTTTGGSGSFQFTNMQPGTYKLMFSKTGYVSDSRNVTVMVGNENHCDIQLSKEVQEAKLSIDPSALNFGTTQTDMSVTIKNNGNATTAWTLDLGNNPWLSASQLAGSIEAGRTQNVIFSVDRSKLTESRAVIVNLQASGNSFPIAISCAPMKQEAEISIDPSSLNFGTTQTDMNVTIKNNGNAAANWSFNLGNNSWLSVSQLSGSIQPGRTQSVTFTVNRDFLSEARSVIVNLEAFGNSYPISVSCAPRNATSSMTVEPKSVDFGTNSTEQSITIRNAGTAPLTWTASGITENAISLSATQGTVAAGGTTVVKVLLDRTQVSGSLSTSFTINDGVKSEIIYVTANSTGGGSGTTPTGDIVESKGLYAYFPFNGSLDDLGENKINAFVSPEASYVSGVTQGTQALAISRKAATTFSVNEGLIDHISTTTCFWVKDIDEGTIFWVTSSNKVYDTSSTMMRLTYGNGKLRYLMSRDNCLGRYGAGSGIGYFTHKSIDDGEWHHIALVSDFNKLNANYVTTTLYIDGILMDTVKEEYDSSTEKNINSRHYDTGVLFTLGGTNTPNMKIAHFRTYNNRKLNADQIKSIYNAKQ